MNREKEQYYQNSIRFIDLVVTFLSLMAAGMMHDKVTIESMLTNREYIIVIFTIIPTWFLLLRSFNVARINRVEPVITLMGELVMVTLIGLAVVFMVIFTFKLDLISRKVVFLFALLNLLILYIYKLLYYYFFTKVKGKDAASKRNVIIFADIDSIPIIESIKRKYFWLYTVKGIISDSKEIVDRYSHEIPVWNEKKKLESIIESEALDEVIFSKQDFRPDYIAKLIYSCEEVGVDFRLQSYVYSMIASKAKVTYFDEVPFYSFSKVSHNFTALLIKQIFDVLFSFFVLLVMSPVMLTIALLVKITSPGPIIFSQKRVGVRGREFNVYKFRTMVQNAEEMKDSLRHLNEVDGPVFKIRKDPRITPIGAFLRKTSLDEFPQFVNVLKGDMSVVGPRPALPEEVAKYKRWQKRRLSMKPGITCSWQVSGRNEMGFDDWMTLDLQYIDDWSLKLDFIIILKTISTVFKRTGA